MTAPRCPVALAATRTPSATALVQGGRAMSYAALEVLVRSAQAGLSRRRVKPGDRVILLGPASPEMVALFFAGLREGVLLAPLNARLAPAEQGALAQRIAPALTLVDGGLGSELPHAELLAGLFAPDPSDGAAAHGSALLRGEVLLFTSGTSGRPKAARLSPAAFEASARASAQRIGGAPDDRWLGTLPLFHVGGLAMLYRAAWAGAALILEPRFDAERIWDLLTPEGITHASFVATTLARLLDVATARGQRAPASLRAVLVGGAPVPLSLWQRARAAGLPVLKTYGLTEATSQVTTEAPAAADGTTAGTPIPGTEVRVVGDAGQPLEEGEVGSIEVRGPTLMLGYWEDAPSTSAAIGSDGWLRTGDVGALDGYGRLRIEARRTDLILSGGENVYPAEIEATLGEHPEIAEAAVIGAPDVEWGEVPVAFVVAKARRLGVEPGGGELERWCRQRLGGFKVPRRIEAVAELPRTALGKVDRGALQLRAAQFRSEERS